MQFEENDDGAVPVQQAPTDLNFHIDLDNNSNNSNNAQPEYIEKVQNAKFLGDDYSGGARVGEGETTDEEQQRNKRESAAAAGSVSQSSSSSQSQPQQPQEPASMRPAAVFATIFFKAASIVFFYTTGLFTSHTVWTFMLVIIFSAFDFWTVKNVTGRLLVGLRWWNEVRENGEEVWLFESQEAGYAAHAFNQSVFWGAQIGVSIYWGVMSIIELVTLSFFWCLLTACACALTAVNVYGFYKCRGEHQKKMRSFLQKAGMKAAKKGIVG